MPPESTEPTFWSRIKSIIFDMLQQLEMDIHSAVNKTDDGSKLWGRSSLISSAETLLDMQIKVEKNEKLPEEEGREPTQPLSDGDLALIDDYIQKRKQKVPLKGDLFS